MATFSQQFGQLGQQANPAITDATQNKNPGGFPNARAKPMPIAAIPPQRTSTLGAGGVQQLPPGLGPRTGPMIDPRFGGPGGFYGRPRQPMNGNIPGVGGVNGIQPGALGRIEKGAWNDPNMRRGMGGLQIDPGMLRGGNQFGSPNSYGADTDALRQMMMQNPGIAAMPMGPRFPGDPNGPRSGGPMAPPQQPGGPTVNRPQQPMTPPNNGGGPANAAGQAAK